MFILLIVLLILENNDRKQYFEHKYKYNNINTVIAALNVTESTVVKHNQIP